MSATDYQTQHWQINTDGRVQCNVCPRKCQLRDNQAGFCQVRTRVGNGIALSTFAKASGLCVDPIEKKPLYHFLPGTAVLSFGTAGCNLACKFCQNWHLSHSKQVDAASQSAAPKDIANIAAKLGCRSVAYTYNDPVIFLEYAVATAQACTELGINNVAVTAGYIEPAARAELFGHMQAANIDLKAFNDDFYHRLCGGRLQPVLETLKYVKNNTSVWLEITTLLIPGLNDSKPELDAMTRWILQELGPDVPLHFSAFHPTYRLNDVVATSAKTLNMARNIALNNGIHYVYVGNVHDPSGNSTWCHGCSKQVIQRKGYQLRAWSLDSNGKCKNCGTIIPGNLESQPGTWGSRRLPINIA
ncbi:pyruvate formate lyase-activating protein [Achromatium sp. WMS2]|nr:pyruvate formate lyase-activating protein [Achromatium sp. WMS2]